MIYIMRDFNVMGNDIGDISIYLSHNKLFVFIMNLHGIGQAWMHVTYSSKIDIYEICLSILNKLTIDICQELLNSENINMNVQIPKYKDIIRLESEKDITEDSIFSEYWNEFYLTFSRENTRFLKEYNNFDIDDAEKYKDSYVISGEILEDGKFIYDKPIRSNHYKEFKIEDESENDMEEDSETEI